MLTSNEVQLFESVARNHPRFREWLASELKQKITVLINVVDTEQLKRAQGHAQCLQGIIDKLDSSANPDRARGSNT